MFESEFLVILYIDIMFVNHEYEQAPDEHLQHIKTLNNVYKWEKMWSKWWANKDREKLKTLQICFLLCLCECGFILEAVL